MAAGDPRDDASQAGESGGYELEPGDPTPSIPVPRSLPIADKPLRAESTFTARKPESPRAPVEPVTEGLLRPPQVQESSLIGSLAYPLWDANSLGLLATLGPICAVCSVFSFGLRDYVTEGNEVERMGSLLMVFPAAILLGLALGSGLRYLESVVDSTVLGEVRPPQRPSLDVFESVACLLRWLVALAPGLLLTGMLALWFYQGRVAVEPVKPGLALQMVAGSLCGAGFAWAALSGPGVALYRTLSGANPLLALRHLALFGGDGLRLVIGFSAFGMAAGVLAAGLYVLPGILMTIAGVCAYWLALWYGLIVLFRRLGLSCRRHALALGWETEDVD